MGNRLYVGNLDFATTAEELTALFSGAGEVRSTRVITDRDTNESKGFAFIEMGTEAQALKAISLFNGKALNQRALVVNEARPQEASNRGTARPQGFQFREIKHKARGGRKAKRY